MQKLRVFFTGEVQRLIDSFASCFRVKITFFSSEMEELIVGFQPHTGKGGAAKYCQAVQQKLNLRQHCLGQDKLMCERCERTHELVLYNCHAGLNEAVIPIIIEKIPIGYAMVGQFRTAKKIPAKMQNAWTEAGFESALLKEAYWDAPYYSQEDEANMLRLFSMMVTYIITKELRVQRPGFIDRLVEYIEDHITDPATLADAAKAINRSKSSISHRLKQQMGISYKQLCIHKRIELFESIIAAAPQMSISEAAARAGYGDPYYFSRIYKKCRNITPSAYLKSVRKTAGS